MKPKFLRFPFLILALTSSAMAGQFIWTGATDSTWTDASNWDTATAPPVTAGAELTYPAYGTDYTDDQLRIANGTGAGAVYNPGSAVTTTFRQSRGIVIGSGGLTGDLTVTSGTIAVINAGGGGQDPVMASGVSANLLLNGGNIDTTGSSLPFYLVFNGASGLTSTMTINTGSTFSCTTLDLFGGAADGTSTINLDGGTLFLNRFFHSAAAGGVSTINLNGGTLRCRNSNANFLSDLPGTQTVVKAGGAIIDTNTFSSTIAEVLEHDAGLGATPDGGLTKINSGALTLSGTNTYTGGTTINGGTIIISSDANLGDSSGGLTFGSTSNLNTTAAIVADRTITLGSGATGSIRLGASAHYTNTGKVTGAGNLVFKYSGNGVRNVLLGNLNNDFTGSIGIDIENSGQNINLTLNSMTDGVGYGNVRFGLTGAVNPSINWGADATGSLILDNRRIEFFNNGSGTGIIGNNNTTYPVTINTDLSVSGTGSKTLLLSGANGPVNEFAGDIANGSGTASLTKTGSAIWTISGNNTYSGGTTIGGTSGTQLNINSATALGTGNITIVGGNNAKIDNTSGGLITLTTNNTQAWNNDFTFVGTNELNLGTGDVTLGSNRTVYVNGPLTVGGVISGAYGITKANWGTLTLTGNSSYTGNTVITTGGLKINSIADYGANSAIGAPASGNIQLGSGNGNFATLNYIGSGDSTNRTVQIGNTTAAHDSAGAIQNNGTGALTFTAAGFNPTIAGITATRTLWLGGNYVGGANEIQGVIQDNDASGKVNLGKGNDDSIWQLSGTNTYTGSTIVQGGTLKLGAAGSIASSSAVSINAGGTLDTSAQASYAIPGAQPVQFGIDAAGSGSSGTIAAAGLDISSAVVTYNITGTPDDPVYVLATYSSLTGASFASVDAPPAGYTLDYAYEGNKIALVESVGSPYDTWAGGPGLPFNGDSNGDGVPNGLAFLLGASGPNVNALGLLPTVTQSGGGLVMTFTCLNAASRGSTVLNVQHSGDLGISDSWTNVTVPETTPGSATSGVTFTVTPGSPSNSVTATISSSEALGGKLFGRLKAVNP